MKLNVDFSALISNVRRMGADNVDVRFDVDVGQGGLDPLDIILEVGIERTLDEIDFDTGLASVQGRQVLLYIQDHGSRAQDVIDGRYDGNKFHVSDCKTLKQMREKGRFERYVVTNDLSGVFPITGMDWSTQQDVEGRAELNVCKNCLTHLNYKNYRYGNGGAVFSKFSIEEFFSTYSSLFPFMPRRRAGEKDGGYTEDWPTVASTYKARKNFICEQCRVDLTDHKKLLHVHHINGVKNDNKISNLKALCADCHRKAPAHGHLHVSHDDMRMINRLRNAQRSPQPHSGWDTAIAHADAALTGSLRWCEREGWPAPVVGQELQDSSGRVVVELEVAWPRQQKAIVLDDTEAEIARNQGWKVWTMSGFMSAHME